MFWLMVVIETLYDSVCTFKKLNSFSIYDLFFNNLANVQKITVLYA